MYITITEKLKRAEKLKEFTNHRGERVLNMPYYTELSDGTLVFDFVRADTDVKKLKQLIYKGKIYTRYGLKKHETNRSEQQRIDFKNK